MCRDGDDDNDNNDDDDDKSDGYCDDDYDKKQ
jgi:hypothetical protein